MPFAVLENIPNLIGTFRCAITASDILLMRYENGFLSLPRSFSSLISKSEERRVVGREMVLDVKKKAKRI